MPKERKHRGRREEQKKRKRDDDDDAIASPKRHKKDEAEPVDAEGAFHGEEGAVDVTRPGVLTYYGMLDDQEQDYFKKADDLLELNQFDDAEARTLFVENVYKEADGKELKIANSQSCSRLLERLIQLSSPEQLKSLFQKFNGQ
jgi:nucleolar protein 9